MKAIKFEYLHKDLGSLKKDITFRTIFSVLFLAILVWQFVIMIMKSVTSSLTVMEIVFACIVISSTLVLLLATLSYVFKDFRIMSAVKMTGKCVSSVNILFSTKKRSFIWLYNLLIQILTLGTTLILIACITYSILQITFLSTISFYMPFLTMICVSGYNSIYHIKDEIYTQNFISEQQPAYK